MIMNPRDLRCEAVVFDLGNVLIGWDPYLPFCDDMSRAEWQELSYSADFSALNIMADKGSPLDEVISQACEKGTRYGEFIERYYDRFDRSLTGPVPGTAKVVDDLKATGVRLLGLTNWSAETIHHAPRHAPAIRKLEGLVVSGQEGVAKPDPVIFRRLIQRYGIDPVTSVFIDDSVHNVETANELGFTAIQFVGAERLRDVLAHRGILSA